jgi:flavin-dependent dehydrogenase
MIVRQRVFSMGLVLILAWCAAAPGGESVNEPARKIPLAYSVDVVVVGASTGAVSAAVAAAKEGRQVFLVAPHPYLGEDMTATLRLWLEAGETPRSALARRVFGDAVEPAVDPNRLAFTYTADVPSAAIHKDTDPPSRLTDGRWGDASKESVQYEKDVTIVADLGRPQEVRTVRVMAFRRSNESPAGKGFDVRRVTFSLSADGKTWRQVAQIDNDQPMEATVTLAAKVGQTARYVQVFVEKPEAMERLLLGEIEIVGPPKPTAVATDAPVPPPPRPMHVKRTLDDALLEAGVQYLYGCFATDVLRDAKGQLCGVVMANRAGRQAVAAKTIIDATPRATVARLAGAKFTPYPGGTHTFRRVVIGGEPVKTDQATARSVGTPFLGPYPNRAKTSSGVFSVIEYSIPLHVDNDSYAAYMRVDQQARSLTYHSEQQFTSDVMFEVPPDAMRGRESAKGDWQGTEQLPLGAFQPAGIDRLYVLGGCADVPRPHAERLLRPVALMDMGERLGKAAAGEAAPLPAPADVKVAGQPAEAAAAEGEVREFLTGVRPTQATPTVPQQRRALPVLGRYDVVVIGGGTGGAPAGIGAARKGAKTLVVEYHYGLGGVGTLGAISSYYWGNRVGFTKSVQDGQTQWVIEQKMEWYRQELLKAGAEIWFGAVACGAFVQDRRVVGAVVATPAGRGVVLAKTVIDATGNSDVAAAAGADCIYTDASEFGMQGTGLPGRRLGESYNNTDFTIVDETDMVDIWQVLVYSKGKYPQAFDHGRLIDTRERRRIVGDFTISLPDQINLRTHPDTVVCAYSNFDSHGYTVDPYLLLEHPEKKGVTVNIPLRSMLPKGLDGIIVTGLSISAHRDAVPLIRMQPDVQNGGYAAGVAAAMTAAAGTPVRQVDVKKLQQHLIEIGNLPERVLTDQDSYPLPEEKIAAAVASLPKEGRGASVIMTHPDRALPLLKAAYTKVDGEDKVAYAKALAVLGSDLGLDTLIAEVRRQTEWDKGWNYKGMGQFGAALSPLDNLLIALGHTRSRKAVPVILEKLGQLDAENAFSHHRAAGLALELIGDRSAARPLAELLAKPDMAGHAQLEIAAAQAKETPGGVNAEQTRRESLRELMLARALYRCGDHQGVGEKILRDYTRDLRGHLARHAQAVLAEKK